MLHLLTRVSALTLIAGVLGCDLDTTKLNAQMEATLEEYGVLIKSVSCPEGKKNKEGETFECTGEAEDGTKFRVAASVKAGGEVKFDLVGRVIDPADVQGRLAAQTGRKLDCGTAKRIAVKGVEIACKDANGVIAVVFTDDEGNNEFASK